MIHLLLAIHNHQPVGNFEHIFEKAFKECYWPLINTIAEFPKVKVSLHHSGPLLDWAKEREPKYIGALVKMIKSGQVEPLGGGYYEPILAVIPPVDAEGQIKMMRDFWETEGVRAPKGIWMTERIWEPSLTTLLADNGVKYTILDDEHFRAAGITDEFILNYHLTERHGKTVAVFASDQALRYKIPFKAPEDVIGHLLWLGEKFPDAAVTYGDDGEKFGLWPGTFEWVVQKGWLKKFFRLLSENSEKIKTATISDFLSERKPSGTVYLPTCSYHEMGEWAMPAHAIQKFDGIKQFLANNNKWDDAKAFVRGGYWDNFLTKYPEANYMHKRMLYVSEKLSSLRAQAKQSSGHNCAGEIASASGLAMTEAVRHLYRAQCNCAYWHGLFGGLYLNYLRHAIYKNLIEAENILDNIGKVGTTINKIDIDCDASDEVIMKNSELIAVIKPNAGAGLIELSHRRSCLNLQNVLARREEAYHKKRNKEAKTSEVASIHDIQKNLPDANPIEYDSYIRYSFMDHIINNGQTTYLCRLPYNINSITKDSAQFSVTADGLSLAKTLSFEAFGIRAHYELKWETPQAAHQRFGTEFNLSLLAGHDEKRYYLLPNGQKHLMDVKDALKNIGRLSLVDEYSNFKLEISSDRIMNVERYPVYTVSQSESGFDLLYQGSCIIWSLPVPEGVKELELNFTLKFTN